MHLSHHMIVRAEHLNQYGYLFGGRVLSVIDELAFITCARAFPGKNFVTCAVRNAEFKAPAGLGDLLEFQSAVEAIGQTSVTVRVQMVVRAQQKPSAARVSFDGAVVMVCVDNGGRPQPVAPNKRKPRHV